MNYRNIWFSGNTSSSNFWSRQCPDQSKEQKIKVKNKNTLLSGARGSKKEMATFEDRDRTDKSVSAVDSKNPDRL